MCANICTELTDKEDIGDGEPIIPNIILLKMFYTMKSEFYTMNGNALHVQL